MKKRKGTKFIRYLPKDAEPITFLGKDKDGVMQAADSKRVYDIAHLKGEK